MRVMLALLLLFNLFPVHIFAEDDKESKIQNINLQKEEFLHYQLSPIDTMFVDKMKLKKLMDFLEMEVLFHPLMQSMMKIIKLLKGRRVIR